MVEVLLEAARGAWERINALQRRGGPLAESWRLLYKQEPTAAFTTAVGTLERFLRQALGHPLMPNGNRQDLYHLLQTAAEQDYISADQQKRLDNMRSRRNHASHGGELRLTEPQARADLDYLGQIIAQIMLGRAVGPAGISNGLPVQLFEKGRLEDHGANTALPPEWRFQYGQLVDELVQAGAQLPIGGDTSTITYADLRTHAPPAARIAPPAGFTGLTAVLTDGSVFIPFTADLSPAPGSRGPAAILDIRQSAGPLPRRVAARCRTAHHRGAGSVGGQGCGQRTADHLASVPAHRPDRRPTQPDPTADRARQRRHRLCARFPGVTFGQQLGEGG